MSQEENKDLKEETLEEKEVEVKEVKIPKNPPAFVKPNSFKNNQTNFRWGWNNNFTNNKQRPGRAASRWR